MKPVRIHSHAREQMEEVARTVRKGEQFRLANCYLWYILHTTPLAPFKGG